MSKELMRAKPVFEIPVGSTGTYVVATLMNNGAAVDISGASGSLLFHSKTIGGTAIVTAGTAELYTDGTDGKVKYLLDATTSGTVRDVDCSFEVQGFNGGNLQTFLFTLRFTPTGRGA